MALAALLPVTALLVGVLTASPASADMQGLLQSEVLLPGSNPATYACLDDWDATQNQGNLVVAYPCSVYDVAVFWHYNQSNDTINPVNRSGDPYYGTCLDVNKGGGVGSLVQLWPCNNLGSQKWQLNSNGQLVNPESAACLDIPNWGTDVTYPGQNPIQMHIWACNNLGPWQQWQFG